MAEIDDGGFVRNLATLLLRGITDERLPSVIAQLQEQIVNQPASGSAGGDLGGSFPNPDVLKVRGHEISSGGTTGQALRLASDGTFEWYTPSTGSGNMSTSVYDTDADGVLNAGAIPDLTRYAPSGLTGATQASRYVGATASGAPASGTFAVGDFVIDRTGKVWICTTAGTPGTWTQVGGSGGGAGGSSVLLNYEATTNLHNGSAVSATTWTDIGSSQTFTVANASSVVEVMTSGAVQYIGGIAGNITVVRIIIDSAGTPQTRRIAAGSTTGTGNFTPLSGSMVLTGLSAGSHTVKLQMYSLRAGSLYLRALSSDPSYPYEALNIAVVERLP